MQRRMIVKQPLFEDDRKNEGVDCESCRRLYVSCRQWMETAGDVDDFIFYQSDSTVSQR